MLTKEINPNTFATEPRYQGVAVKHHLSILFLMTLVLAASIAKADFEKCQYNLYRHGGLTGGSAAQTCLRQ